MNRLSVVSAVALILTAFATAGCVGSTDPPEEGNPAAQPNGTKSVEGKGVDIDSIQARRPFVQGWNPTPGAPGAPVSGPQPDPWMGVQGFSDPSASTPAPTEPAGPVSGPQPDPWDTSNAGAGQQGNSDVSGVKTTK